MMAKPVGEEPKYAGELRESHEYGLGFKEAYEYRWASQGTLTDAARDSERAKGHFRSNARHELSRSTTEA